MPAKRSIVAEDIYRFKMVSDVRMHPEEDCALFTVMRCHPEKEKDTYESHIWIKSGKDSSPRQFTQSNQSESSPRWSPDGKRLLFLSSREGGDGAKEANRIWTMPSDGGEALPLTDGKASVSSPQWSPDGKQILFLQRVHIDKNADKEDDVAHIKRISYRWNGMGNHFTHRTHLFVISAQGGKARQVTQGDWDVKVASWSHDGKSLFYTANPNPDADLSYRSHLYSLTLRGKKTQQLTQLKGWIFALSPSPDGKQIAFLGSDLKRSFGTNNGLFCLSLTGNKKQQHLTRKHDIDCAQTTNSDMRGSSPGFGPLWSPDSTSIQFLATVRGANRLFRLTLADKSLKQLTHGETTIESLSYNRDQTEALYTEMSPTQVSEAWRWSLPTEKRTRITHFNDKLLAQLKLSAPQRITFKASDKTVVEGWIHYPPRSKKKKHPAILQIHGGPRTAYGMGFIHEFHLLAAAGYAVFYTNPRGSSSYGEDWTVAVSKHYGERDYKDLMELTDYVVKNEAIDPQRMGVTGGSYGGFMTNWIVGHTQRYKAACTQRCISNWISFFGTSDIGWGFTENEIGVKPPWRNLDEYWKRSPLAYVDKIKTPLLIIHAEEDWRCPIEQAEQLFTALKWRDQKAEFIRFPGENHELSRSGKPKHRIRRLNAIKQWFNDHL